jgi:thiamine biosynthesis protein ThiI
LNALIVHHHELGLKGRNRDYFEQTLVRNLRAALLGTGHERIRRGFGRIMVDFPDPTHIEEAAERAARLFGVAYVGMGVRVRPELAAIEATCLELMTAEPFESFRVQARRTHSTLEQRSHEIHEVVGAAIKDATGGRVDLKHAEATAWVELFGSTGIVYRKRIEGTGGLPAGVSGRMICLLSGGIDSPVAAWRMARRGARVELVHFHGQPFTDPSSVRQAAELAEAFNRFNVRSTLYLIPIGDAQREIVTHAPSEMRVVLYRRLMLRVAAELARQTGAKALITGDALGQVASQTIENITTADDAVPGVQIMRPLLGMTKQEIINDAKAIGTYAISTRRYQDCCVLFEPRSPIIRSKISDAESAEKDVDVHALVGKALAAVETRVFELPLPATNGSSQP